ncbi:MAG: COG3650 family protein [Pseudomonas sp.]
MPAVRTLLFALLPLFAGCQLFAEKPASSAANLVRLQGELNQDAGQLLFRPCQEQRRFLIANHGNTGLQREAAELLADGPGPLFADLRGSLAASPVSGADGALQPERFYRVQREGQGCDDLNFKRLTLRASGHEPEWNLNVSGQGLVLERPGQPALALPYLEEQLPEGRFNLTSEANDQRLELWVAPQRCVDSLSGAVQHLSAELRLNGQVQRGCAYYGGARND